MKYRLGVTRSSVADDGTVFRILRGDDVLEIDVPEDGSEFLSTIWLDAEDGMPVLRLPLTIAPALSSPIQTADNV